MYSSFGEEYKLYENDMLRELLMRCCMTPPSLSVENYANSNISYFCLEFLLPLKKIAFLKIKNLLARELSLVSMFFFSKLLRHSFLNLTQVIHLINT